MSEMDPSLQAHEEYFYSTIRSICFRCSQNNSSPEVIFQKILDMDDVTDVCFIYEKFR